MELICALTFVCGENSLKYYTIKISKAFKYNSDVSNYDTLNGQGFYLFCVTVLVSQNSDAGLSDTIGTARIGQSHSYSHRKKDSIF